MNRRDWLDWLIKAGSLSAVGAYGYGSSVERHLLTHERVEVRLANIGPGLSRLKIVQISDLHLHPITSPELIERTVNEVNRLEPDVVFITGDFITRKGDDAGELADILKRLKPTQGSYGVLGNHDGWHSPATVIREISRAGIRMLVNEREKLTINGEPLWIGGTDTVWAGSPQLDPVMPEDKKMPAVLLIHEPDYADVVALRNREVLQLSGHSHGGQVRAPLFGAPVTVEWGKRYIRGLHHVGRVKLYVNRGIGCTGLGVRFASAPEITRLTLLPA